MMYRLRRSVILVLVLASAVGRAQTRDSLTSSAPLLPAFGGSEQRMIVLAGRVVSEDGFALPESVTVILECGSQSDARTHSDAKGYFSLTVAVADSGPNRGLVGSRTGTGSGLSIMGCELYGELAGYRSEHIRLSDRPDGGIVQVGTIAMHSASPEHSFSVSVTSLAAPEKAKKSLQKGREQAKKGKWAAAADYFKRAIEEYPRYALAWVELGRTQVRQNSFADAQASFRQSTAQDSRFLDAYVELAYLAGQQKQWKELADTSEHLVQLAPNSPEFWFLNSVATFNLGNPEQAETSIKRGLRLDQKHQIPEMEYLYGLILMNHQDYSSAAAHLSTYLGLAPAAKNAQTAQKILVEIQTRAQDSTRASR